MKPRPLFPSSLFKALSCLIFVVSVLAALLLNETPTGTMQGVVYSARTGLPIPRARIVLSNMDEKVGVKPYRARTDEEGRFSISRVQAGLYLISASSSAHAGKVQNATVTEAASSEVSFRMERSNPDLELAPIRRTRQPGDVKVPLRGYLDHSTDQVTLDVYRTTFARLVGSPRLMAHLNQVGDRYQQRPGLPAELVAAAQPVTKVKFSPQRVDAEGFFHEDVPLDLHQPGVYLINAANGVSRTCTWVLVTKIGLVVKKAPGAAPATGYWDSATVGAMTSEGKRGHFAAYVCDLQDGRPQNDAQVTAFADGRRLATAPTREGVSRLLFATPESSSHLNWLATLGDSEVLLGAYDYSGENGGNYRVATYTDRTLYRPGDTLFFKGIVRQVVPGRSPNAANSYAVAQGLSVELELRDPSGNRIYSDTTTTNDFGSYWGGATLSPEAPTGYYTLVSTVDGEERTHDILVSAYRKPEMTLKVRPAGKVYRSGQEAPFTLEATYYSGAPVTNGRVRYEIYRETDWGGLGGENSQGSEAGIEGDELEEEPEGDYFGEYVRSGTAQLDGEGKATIAMRTGLSPDEATESATGPTVPQREVWTIEATVEDESERSVSASSNVVVSAGNFFLDLQPDGYLGRSGTAKRVDITVRDLDGKPLNGQPLTASWSYSRWDPETEKTTETPGGSAPVVYDSGTPGRATVSINVEKAGSMVVRVAGKDNQGNEVSAETTIWVQGEEELAYAWGGENDLSILADRNRYGAGETARLVVRSREAGGSALLTVEGDALYLCRVLQLDKTATEVQLPLSAAYGPNITVSVSRIYKGKFSQGELPLGVAVPQRGVKVQVTADKTQYQPGEVATYSIQTTTGEGKPVAAEYSLAVVDQAIYALAEEDKRLLQKAFYPRRNNGVQTSQSLQFEYLGDANKADPDIKARSRFRDTAYWMPDGRTDASGRATVRVNLPDNLTRWRATAWAQTKDSAFGRGEAEIGARKPFFVRLDKPRFTVVGDTTRLQGFVRNDTGQDQNVTLALEAPGLQLSGAARQEINVPAGSEHKVEWAATVKGPAEEIRFKAWTAGNSYNDAVVETLPVRPFGRDVREYFTGSSGESASGALARFELEPNSTGRRLTFHVTPSSIDAFPEAFQYLVGFPYGCTEQTTSRMVPTLLANSLTPEQKAHALRGVKVNQMHAMVEASIVRLTRFQQSEGGWGWWEYDEADPFLTAYVLQGLTTARAQGFSVPAAVLENGAEAALKMVREPAKNEKGQLIKGWGNRVPALLMAAASANKVNEAVALRQKVQLKDLDTLALADLALFDRRYAPGNGKTALNALLGRALSQGATVRWRDNDARWDSDWNGLTATARALEALLAWKPGHPYVPRIVRGLLMEKRGTMWNSTRDTAAVLAALTAYNRTVPAPAGAPEAETLEFQVDGKTIRTLRSDQAAREAVVMDGDRLAPGRHTAAIKGGKNVGELFFSVEVTRVVPLDSDAAIQAEGFTIQREYLRLADRKGSWQPVAQLANGTLNGGENIKVRLTLNTKQHLSYLMVEDAFPPGCEPTERGSSDVTNSSDWTYWWDATEIRDDRIAVFARKLAPGKHVIEYSLRAQTPGQYRVLPAVAYPMYAPELRCETGVSPITIR